MYIVILVHTSNIIEISILYCILTQQNKCKKLVVLSLGSLLGLIWLQLDQKMASGFMTFRVLSLFCINIFDPKLTNTGFAISHGCRAHCPCWTAMVQAVHWDCSLLSEASKSSCARKKRKITIDNNCIPITTSYVEWLAADHYLGSVKHQDKVRGVSIRYCFGPWENVCYKLFSVVRYSSFYFN